MLMTLMSEKATRKYDSHVLRYTQKIKYSLIINCCLVVLKCGHISVFDAIAKQL